LIVLLTPELLQAMKRILDDNELVWTDGLSLGLKLTREEAKDLVEEAMQARGWSNFTLLLEESVMDAIRRDVIRMRFEGGRFRDRGTGQSREDAGSEELDLDSFWTALRKRCSAIDTEVDLAILAVLHDHLATLLGERSELRLSIPPVTWKN
jgi:hypothetical protein